MWDIHALLHAKYGWESHLTLVPNKAINFLVVAVYGPGQSVIGRLSALRRLGVVGGVIEYGISFNLRVLVPISKVTFADSVSPRRFSEQELQGMLKYVGSPGLLQSMHRHALRNISEVTFPELERCSARTLRNGQRTRRGTRETTQV